MKLSKIWQKMKRLEIESDEAEDVEAAEGAAAAASLQKLKEDGLERLMAIKALYTKAHGVLLKKGSQDKAYLKFQEKISEEMMGYLFYFEDHRTFVRFRPWHG